MAQFYSLDEAARVLGMSSEELATKAQDREVRGFKDSGSWQFRLADIDELARRRGMGSDPDLSLSDLDLVAQAEGDDLNIDLSDYQIEATDPEGSSLDPIIEATSGDVDIEVDNRALPPLTNSSSTIIGMGHAGKLPSDSDVRLMPESGFGASDSDVRLAPAGMGGPSESDVRLAPPGVGAGRPSDSDVTLVSDDDLGPVSGSGSSDVFPAALGSDSGMRSSPRLGSSEEVSALDDSSGSSLEPESDSDFELTPSNVIDALQPESGSDFELSALDASDEFEATPLHGPGDSDVTAADPAASGINLGRPSDSGINLQGVGGLGLDDQADSIELAPLDDDAPPPRPAPKAPMPTPAPRAAAKVEKDIFEDTDFEVDALDADNTDQTVQLEAGSDYDFDDDDVDSGSEVFAVDEEDVDQNAATAMASGIMVGEDDDEEEESGESASAWDIDSEGGADEEPVGVRASAASTPALVASGAGAEWGGLWVGLLSVATVLILLLAFVSLDLVRNLYDFRGPTPVASGLVKMLAGLTGGS